MRTSHAYESYIGRLNRRGLLQGVAGSAAAFGLVGTEAACAGTVRWRGTTSDGVDVTAALNRRIRSTPNGSTLLLPRNGKFRVDGTLALHDRHDLVIDGNGSVLYSMVTSPLTSKPVTPMFDLLGGSNITLRNMELRGTNPAPEFVVQREWQPFIDIRGTQGVLVRNIQAVGAWGDFVHIAPDTRPEDDVMASHITIRDCRAEKIGRNQVSFTGCEDVLVQSCAFTGTGYQVFDIEVQASWWRARRLTMLDNLITGKVSLSVLVNAAAGLGVQDVEFARNTMLSTPVSCEPPVNLLGVHARKSNFSIHDNVLRSLSSGARVAGVTRLDFRGNEVTLSSGGGCRDSGIGIVPWSSSDILIRDNRFAGGFRTVVPEAMPATVNVTVSGNSLV